MTRFVWLYALYKFFKFVIPQLLKVAWYTLKLVLMTMGKWMLNIPKDVKAIARDWSYRANVAGVPSEFDREIYYGSEVVAFVMIVAGWVISAYLTVWIVGLLF
jgi:hypothetical protein